MLRCYSCSWSRDDTARMFECMNGSDLEVTSNVELQAPNSEYISHAQCAQCRKMELYKGGETFGVSLALFDSSNVNQNRRSTYM